MIEILMSCSRFGHDDQDPTEFPAKLIAANYFVTILRMLPQVRSAQDDLNIGSSRLPRNPKEKVSTNIPLNNNSFKIYRCFIKKKRFVHDLFNETWYVSWKMNLFNERLISSLKNFNVYSMKMCVYSLNRSTFYQNKDLFMKTL